MLCVHRPDQKLLVMQDELLAEQLQQAADRGQKWKSRCAKLRQELMETQTSAAALEAALNVGSCLQCFTEKLFIVHIPMHKHNSHLAISCLGHAPSRYELACNMDSWLGCMTRELAPDTVSHALYQPASLCHPVWCSHARHMSCLAACQLITSSSSSGMHSAQTASADAVGKKMYLVRAARWVIRTHMYLATQEPPRLHHAPKTPKSLAAGNRSWNGLCRSVWLLWRSPQKRLVNSTVRKCHAWKPPWQVLKLPRSSWALSRLSTAQQGNLTCRLPTQHRQKPMPEPHPCSGRLTPSERRLQPLALGCKMRPTLSRHGPCLNLTPLACGSVKVFKMYTTLLCSFDGTECTTHQVAAT